MPKRRGESAEFALSEAQMPKVLAACLDLIDRVIIGLQIWCGLRVQEVTHLNEKWITQQGEIKVPSQMKCNCAECMRHPKHPGEWRPKTPAGARTLHIPSRLRKDLAELLKIQPYGIDISRVAVWGRTKRILKRAGVKFKGTAQNTGFPHCLRATCATMLAANSDMTEFELSYYMGWKDINMAKFYVQLARTKPRALSKAQDIFG